MKKRAILVILISFLIISIEPIIDIIFSMQNNSTMTIEAASVTTKDLTGLMTGSDASHTHIYERKYNTTQHWEQCWICGNKRNIANHNLERTPYSWGYASCYPDNTYTIYCRDGCGYNITTKDQCVSNNTLVNESIRYLHHENCVNCRVWMNAVNCTDSRGRNITCQNLGTCTKCGHVYTTALHYITNDGCCQFCGKKFVQLVNSRVTYSSDNSYAILEWRLRGINGGILTGNAGWYSPNPATSKTPTIIKNADNDYTYQYKIVFSPNVQNNIFATFNSTDMIKINGNNTWFSSWTLSAYYDHKAPTSSSITATGNGSSSKYSTKAVITAKVNETFSDTVEMRLLSSDKKTVLSNWGAATKSGTTFTRAFDVVAEIRAPQTLYVESRDKRGNVCTQQVQVQYIDAKAPTLTSSNASSTNWSKNKQITYTATDQGIGGVQIGFNTQNDLAVAEKNGDTYSRTYNFVGDVYGTVTGALYLKDALGNITTQKVTISNIDNTAPTITNVAQSVANNKRSSQITVTANDINTTLNKSGSGIAGYAITTNNSAPSADKYQASNQFTVNKNGTYYVWVKDNVGNVSNSRSILVKDLVINISGTITYSDENNKYNSRIGTNIKIYRKIGNGTEEQVGIVSIVAGAGTYIYETRECNDRGEYYTYRIEQENMPGYKTTYEGNNVTCSDTTNKSINIRNELIIPTYISSVEYETINTYENRYLKNGKIKVKAGVANTNDNTYSELGLNNGMVTLEVDSGIEIDKSSINIIYTKADGSREAVTEGNYGIANNVLTINFGAGKVSKVRERIDLELIGTIKEIKEYNNKIRLNGNLRSYSGENTSINLGTLTNKEKGFTVEYQMPQAKILLRKVDSVTNKDMTDVEFTLYEWNGSTYEAKEILRDTNRDGYYESNNYEWKKETDGRYKIEETKISRNHKDNGFNMEFRIDELKTENYYIIPKYEDEKYKAKYKIEPDGLNKVDGIVENEPYKLNIKIHNIDSETKQEIGSNAIYKIYQWNNIIGQYEEYTSYLINETVDFGRQPDRTYLLDEWIYYTDTNEGKYKVIEELAAYGYYGDYETETKEKREYDVNILEIIETGKYNDQEIENEGIIEIYNNADRRVKSERVKAQINVQAVDSESKKNVAQGDGTLEGAVYGLYAREQINHADGTTSRYEGELGVLYKKDEQVTIVQTDKEGKFTIDEIEGGKYYLKQIKANEGYVADEREYEFDLTYQGQEVEKIIKNQIVFLTPIKQAFQIVKLNVDYQNDINPLPGAGFRVYLISNLSIVKEGKISKNEDGTYNLNDEEAKQDETLSKKINKNGTYNLRDLVNYYYKIVYKTEEEMKQIPRGEDEYYPYRLENEEEAIHYGNGEGKEEVGELYSDEEGYIKSPELAYGEYIIIETTVPDNYEAANPFEMKVNNDSREAKKIKYVYDPNFESRIKIHLIDKDTKKDILKQGTKLVIENRETGELVTYKDGKSELGTYEEPYEITRKDGLFITPTNLRVGRYVIKQIEAPEGYVLRGKEGYTEQGELKADALGDVEFEIGTNQMYYVDDYYEDNISVVIEENKEQVSTIELNVKGEALETINKKKEVIPEWTYKLVNEEEIEPIYRVIDLEGVKVGLYAKEDIYTQDNQGTVRYKKDELVRQGITDDKGIMYFENVEIGKYYIKEIDTIEGYTTNKTIIEVETKYNINKTEENKNLKENSNEWKEEAQKTAVVFMKANTLKDRQKVNANVESKDIDEKNIWGTIYGIYAKEDILNYKGEVVIKADELLKVEQTNEEGKARFNIDLPLGMYYVKEIKAQQGYLTNKTKEEINAMYNLEEGKELKRTVKFINDYTKTRIYVKDKETKEEVIGAILKITDKEGRALIEQIESKEGGVGIIKMPIGKYNLEETEIEKIKEKGYVTTRKIEFEIKEIGEEQEVIFEQDHTKITFEVEDKDRKEIEEGEFIIKDKEGKEVGKFVVNVGVAGAESQEIGNSKGEEEQEKGELQEARQIIERLPIGKYTIESEKLPEQYKKISSEFEIADTQGIQVYTLKTEHEDFDLSLQKWANKIILIEDGKQKVRLTEINPDINPEKIMRVDLNKKRIENTIIKFVYTIRVTNKGKIAGYVKEIKDKIPEGLELAVGENREWKEENGVVVTRELADKELKPGESAEVEIVLKWKNSGENIGVKENIAEIVKTENKYGIEEKREGNEGKSIVALAMVTGKEEIRVWITGGIIFVSVISLGVILIKRYVI